MLLILTTLNSNIIFTSTLYMSPKLKRTFSKFKLRLSVELVKALSHEIMVKLRVNSSVELVKALSHE